ncbi:hypothetical protein ACF0H5_012582 [Mactra antiquata]
MASRSPSIDVKIVIQKNWTTLVEELNAKDLLDLLLERQFLSSIQYRDISEVQLTSDKNRQVLELATKKGIKGYDIFKQCLRETGYEHLADLLDSTEKELKKKQVVIPKKVAVPKKVALGDKPSAGSISHSKSEKSTERFSKPDGEVIYSRETPAMSQKTKSQVERRPPSSQSSSDVGNAEVIVVTEADLMTIASDVLGDNWELLTPSLGINYVTIQQVIADNLGNRVQQIFVVLCKWMYSLGSNATLQELEKKIRNAPSSVTIDWKNLDELMQRRRNAEPSQQGRMTEASPGYHYPGNGIAHRMENVSLNSPDQIGNTRRLGGDVSNSFRIDHSDTSGPQSADNNSNVGLVQQMDGLDIVDAQAYNTQRQDQVQTLPSLTNPAAISNTQPLNYIENIERNLDNLKRSFVGQPQPSRSSQAVAVQPRSTSPRQVLPSHSHSQATVEENNDMFDGPTGIFLDNTKEKGRLKVLNLAEISKLKNECAKLIGEGAFGKVYASEREIPGLKLKIVMKIIVNLDNIDKMRAITNEKLASRTLHFGIVPLLMYGSDVGQSGSRGFYFITPFLENGNLYDAIQKDALENDQSKKKLTRDIRLKILYHIASAIHFLHTPVDKFRQVVCHMDIKSLNIVLDSKYNARLIDFGLAREMLEGNTAGTTRTTLPGTEGYFQTASFKEYTIYSDYYSFGVVILELLTGWKPVSDDGRVHLRKIFDISLIEFDIEQMWKNEKEQLYPVTETLFKLSLKCRERPDKKNISSKDIVKILNESMADLEFKKWIHKEQIKCDICMQYDAVSDDTLQHNRNCHMKVCVTCMRNSYCNPIWCHTCSQEIIPNIGREWVGMILAGNDTKNKTLAQVFSEDGEKIKTVVTSKCPLVMGMSEELLVMVKPKTPGEKENMKDNLMQAFDKLNQLLIRETHKTLFLYYSGHYDPEKGFQLGHVDEFIPLDEFQECLIRRVASSAQIRMIVLLDCCNAPGFFQFPRNITLIQINSSTPNAPFRTDKGGSIFQRLFTQAFTGQALSYKCQDITESTKECKDCKIDGDFVTVEKLQEFIDKHYKACFIESESKPTIFVQNAMREDVRIGYVVNFYVDMSFNFEWKGKKEKIDIPPRTFSSIVELKTILFNRVVEWLPVGHGPPLSTEVFRDILLVFTTSGPDSTKPGHRRELDTMEKINMAWESRRQLYVTLRDASGADDRLVGVFSGDMSKIIDDLLKKDIKMCDDKTAEVLVQCKSFLIDEVYNKFKSNPDLADLTGVAKSLVQELIDKPGVTKLKVKFPYEEHGRVKYRKDFLCFNLVKDNQPSSE